MKVSQARRFKKLERENGRLKKAVAELRGSIFQDTHKKLTVWSRAIWWVTGQKKEPVHREWNTLLLYYGLIGQEIRLGDSLPEG